MSSLSDTRLFQENPGLEFLKMHILIGLYNVISHSFQFSLEIKIRIRTTFVFYGWNYD